MTHHQLVAAPQHFVLIAGEASGDQLGAGLIRELKTRLPNARFSGIGGPQMIAAGLDCWTSMDALSVMGLSEVLRHLPRLLRLRRWLREKIQTLNPDCFIGIDAPDFNLGLEKRLKAAGIPTVHYVSPSIWAWREQRAQTIAQSADRVLCLFPMEPPIYARYGVNARFVGHPVADRIATTPDQVAARAQLNVASDKPVLCVMPGSRLSEINRLGVLFLQTALQLARHVKGLEIIIPAANAKCKNAIHDLVARQVCGGLVRVIDGQSHAAMIAADAVLLASGTAALEAMLAKKPMVVSYKVSALTYFIVNTFGLMKTDRYSLPNILAGEDLVPELMQEKATLEHLLAALKPFFDQPERFEPIRARFESLHQSLIGNADHAAADAVIELLQNKTQSQHR